MPYTKHKLGKTYYASKGKKADGIPLVCLHGGPGGSIETLLPLLELSSSRKVYMYDQLGGGKSSRTKQKHWTVQTFVKELDYLVKAWKLEKFHLFGASWGTTLALEYYLRRKNNGVQSLIFQSPMFSAKDWAGDANELIKKLPAKTRKVINYCHEIGATDSKVYETAMLEFYLKHVLRNKKLLYELFSKKDLLNHQIYEYMWGPSEFKPTGTLKDYNRTGELKKIRVPSLFICGQYDEARPATVKKYSKKVKGAQFREIKGASHAITLEKKTILLNEMDRFLKQ